MSQMAQKEFKQMYSQSRPSAADQRSQLKDYIVSLVDCLCRGADPVKYLSIHPMSTLFYT
jgi:hypothetical protein